MRTFQEILNWKDESTTLNTYYADSDEEANELLNLLEQSNVKAIGFDTETTGLYPESDDCNIRLIQFAWEEEGNFATAIELDVWNLEEETLERIEMILSSANPVKVGQNLKFDIKFSKKLLNPSMRFGNVFDTMIASQVLTFGHIPSYKHSLEAISLRYLDLEIDKAEQLSDWSKEYLDDQQLLYAGVDALLPLLIRKVTLPIFEEEKLARSLRNILGSLEPIAKFEFDGIYLNKEKWLKQYQETVRELQEVSDEIYRLLPSSQPKLFSDVEAFNIRSNELAVRLQNQGIVLPKTDKGNDSTSKLVLGELIDSHPSIPLLIRHSELTKSETSYGLKWIEQVNEYTNRIHSTLNAIWADTSRMSSFNPNIQQVPRLDLFRGCFEAEEGNSLIIADYSQIELRILANRSRDKVMIDGFVSGRDFHTNTAAQIFEVEYEDVTADQRQFAKTLNFGIVYGIGAPKFAYMVGIDEDEAQDIIDRYLATYKGASEYLNKSAREAVRYKRAYTELGFQARYYFDRTDKKMKSRVERLGKNMPIQGTSAEITRRAVRVLYDACHDEGLIRKIKFVNIVHDEIIVETEKALAERAEEILVDSMVKAGEEFITRLPVKVDSHITERWTK